MYAEKIRFSYYPGCSLHSTGKEYGESTRTVCNAFGIELSELKDWSCCGATAAHSLNPALAYELCRRNLEIAFKEGKDLLVPCSSCYNNLKRTHLEMLTEESEEKTNKTLNQAYSSKIKIFHLLELLYTKIGLEVIAQRVKNPLNGIQPAAYYGCLITRPPVICDFDSIEHPQSMDKILQAIGCNPVKWSYKTDCCGASLSLPNSEVVSNLVEKLIINAKDAGANCIVTACPLCQTNLETRQKGKDRMPVFYITELLGVSLGINPKSWLKKHIINPFKLLKTLKTIKKDKK
jgi:heterodisulfide reductase subunit B